MSTTLTPPPSPDAPGPAGAPVPPSRGSSRTVAVVLGVVGAVVVIGALGATVFGTVLSARVEDRSFTADTRSVTALDVDAAAARVTVEFADRDDAVLDVTGARGQWSLERDGDTLVVRSPRGPFFSWWMDEQTRATLTLPSSLGDDLDTTLSLDAGELRATGAFGDVTVDLDAGAVTLEGSARSLALDVGAGRADVDLVDVATVDLGVSAGGVYARFDGEAPESVAITVSAGTVEAALPDDEYDVRSQVEAGGFDNGLRTSSSAPSTVTVDVSAGRVALQPTR